MRIATSAAMLVGSLVTSCGGRRPPTGPLPGTPRIGLSPTQIAFVGVAGSGTQVLQLLSGTSGALASSSGLRVAILRVM
ncbi:MAG: hypothetical protein ACREOC_17190 [Gemmatimonadales bacterium]